MYINKNKGFSLLETIVSASLALIIASAFLASFFPISKTFFIIDSKNKREKNISSLKALISSHLNWTKSKEIRIVDIIEKDSAVPFSKIFSKPSEKDGNMLIIKFYFFNKLEERIEIRYRTFSFIDNIANNAYFETNDVYMINNFLYSIPIIDNCEGRFFLDENNKILKVQVKDLEEKNKKNKEKNYEYLLQIN